MCFKVVMNWHDSRLIFTARRYASAVYAVVECPSVHLFVRRTPDYCLKFLADRTIGRAYATVSRLSVRRLSVRRL